MKMLPVIVLTSFTSANGEHIELSTDTWVANGVTESEIGNFVAAVGYDAIEDYCERMNIPYPDSEIRFDYYFRSEQDEG